MTKVRVLVVMVLGIIIALAAAGVGVVRWRTRGDRESYFQWSETSRPTRCQTLHFPWAPEKGTQLLTVTAGPLQGYLLFTPGLYRGSLPRWERGVPFLVWSPTSGSMRPLENSDMELNSIDYADKVPTNCSTDDKTYVKCESTRLSVPPRQWWMGQYVVRAVMTSDNAYAAVLSEDKLQHGTGGFGPSLGDYFRSYVGEFRLQTYSLLRSGEPLVSLRGRYSGNDFHQATFISSFRWLANRYLFFRTGLTTAEYCLCDMEKK